MNVYKYLIPEYAVQYLINNDSDNLTKEEQIEIDEFCSGVMEVLGNCMFHPSEDFEQGFRHYNDINNLGANCYELIILSEF